jgi:hypothetical protein
MDNHPIGFNTDRQPVGGESRNAGESGNRVLRLLEVNGKLLEDILFCAAPVLQFATRSVAALEEDVVSALGDCVISIEQAIGEVTKSDRLAATRGAWWRGSGLSCGLGSLHIVSSNKGVRSLHVCYRRAGD